MFKKAIIHFMLFPLFLLSFCSSEIPDFQTNSSAGGVRLLHLFDDYDALGLFWDNIDGKGFNERLADTVNRNRDDFVIFSFLNKDIINLKNRNSGDLVLQDMLKDLRAVLMHLQDDSKMHENNRDSDPFYTQSPGEYLVNFYSFLDTMSDTEISDEANTLSDSVIGIGRIFLDYVTEEKSAEEIRDFMEDVTGMIKDLDQDDFIDLTGALGKAFMRTSSPMWWDGADFTDGSSGTNTGLGNLTKGVHALLTGMSGYIGKSEEGETEEQIASRTNVRNALYDIVREFNSILSAENADVFKSLICNLEKFFTEDGSVYGERKTDPSGGSADAYNNNIYNTDNDQLYSDAEIRKTLKETLVGQLGLLVREDRGDTCLIKDPSSKRYFMDRFIEDINRLGIDWDKANLEESLYDLVRFDCFGRDRRIVNPASEKTNAYSASLIESFLFLGGITTNFGWEHGGTANEVDEDAYGKVARKNGHGDFTGAMSMNDSLYSISSKKELDMIGIYELVFEGAFPRNHYRSRNVFNRNNCEDYRFNFNLNYPALGFASGAVAGEIGLPTGGNPNGGTTGLNEYVPYSSNGTHEPGLAGFTMSWAMRACWEGEGPYYYADPEAGTETIQGKTYNKYMRPNGKIYAYVYKDPTDPDNANMWEYIYPVEDGETADGQVNGIEQRFNRFKSSWSTDYFMIRGDNDSSKYYTPEDMSGNATEAGRFHYNELISENEPIRACRSQEEAIFRNYQWVMTEKKMVLAIPMHSNGSVGSALLKTIGNLIGINLSWLSSGLLFPLESACFQVMEANGFTGLVSCRKFRGNGVWAKANHGNDASQIPGDYRMSLLVGVVKGIQLKIPLLNIVIFEKSIDAATVYDATLGRGTANPAVAGYNLPPLYRFAFPRQDAFRDITNPGNTYTYQQCQMGSREFAVGDKNWKERNTLIPIIAALFGRLREESTPENHSLVRMLNGLLAVVKPWMFYNKNISGVCKGGWLPRIRGEEGSTYQSSGATHAKFLMPDWKIKGFIPQEIKPNGLLDANHNGRPEHMSDKTAWFGGWNNRNYFQPQDVPTMVSVLFDTDPSINRSTPSKRADGPIALLTEYDVTKERSGSNQSKTKIVTNLIKFLSGLGDERFDDKFGINYSASHFDEATYHKWGARRKILYGMEQALTSAKMDKTEGIRLTEAKPTRLDGGKELDLPEWIFTKRDCDLDLDWGLEKLIGPYTEDGEVKGLLATYPDNGRQLLNERLAVFGTRVIDELEQGIDPADFSVQVGGAAINCRIDDQGNGTGIIRGDDIHRTGTIDLSTGEIVFTLKNDPGEKDVTCSYRFDRDWGDFYEAFETIEKFLGKNGSYGITEKIIDLMNTVLVQYSFSDDEFKGMMYSLGKILSWYDGSDWVTQGDDGFNNLYRLLKNYLPFIHETVLKNDSGSNYNTMLVLLKDMMNEDGLVDFLIDEIDCGDYSSEVVLDELNAFLGSYVVTSPDSDLWSTLSDLLGDLAGSIDRCSTPEGLKEVFEDYDFQYNGY